MACMQPRPVLVALQSHLTAYMSFVVQAAMTSADVATSGNAQYISVAICCCLPKTQSGDCWALSPAHCVVVNIDLTQAAHHVQLIACAINI